MELVSRRHFGIRRPSGGSVLGDTPEPVIHPLTMTRGGRLAPPPNRRHPNAPAVATGRWSRDESGSGVQERSLAARPGAPLLG
jgi:hypothetical protein